MGNRLSMNGFPSSSGAHLGSTAQVRCHPAKLCLSDATAGKVWMISPKAPSRTTRMRPLAGLLMLSMLDQPASPAQVGFFQPYHFRRVEALDKSMQFFIVRD